MKRRGERRGEESEGGGEERISSEGGGAERRAVWTKITSTEVHFPAPRAAMSGEPVCSELRQESRGKGEFVSKRLPATDVSSPSIIATELLSISRRKSRMSII